MLILGRRDTGAKNYLDRTVSAVWAVCSISILTVAVPLSLFYHVSMLFSVVVLIGIGTTITGRIIRDTTTTAAGFLFTLSALIYPLRSAFFGEIPSGAAADVIRWHSVNNIIFAVQFFVFMVIPGHILNHKTNRQCSGN